MMRLRAVATVSREKKATPLALCVNRARLHASERDSSCPPRCCFPSRRTPPSTPLLFGLKISGMDLKRLQSSIYITDSEWSVEGQVDKNVFYLGYTFAKPKPPPGSAPTPRPVVASFCTTDLTLAEEEEKSALVGHTKNLPGDAARFLEDHKDQMDDLLSFRVVHNHEHASDLHLAWSADLRSIFSTQLPNMPKEYIVRLVFDWRHRSLVALKHGKAIGGITLRPFYSQGFLEITFCAITAAEQMSGYGSYLMNHLKEYAKTQKLMYFLTYADNNAIGYFKKQGFTLDITMDKRRWGGFIKDYQGGTLMECCLHSGVNYLDRAINKKYRKQIHDKVLEITRAEKRYPGVKWKGDGKRMRIEDIPGIKESTWAQCHDLKKPLKNINELTDELRRYLVDIQKMEQSWPFREPVDPTEVADYYKVIKDPMDLRTMEERLNTKEFYITRDIFFADLKRMCNNCRMYNPEDSIYFKLANKVEDRVRELFYTDDQDPSPYEG